MMTPESITVSLEWAKRLKEAGWTQDECRFVHQRANNNWNGGNWFISTYWNYPKVSMAGTLAAPTAEEILRKLPLWIKGDSIRLWLQIAPDGKDEWQVSYFPSMNQSDKNETWKNADTLANAAAAMWVYLKENNLLPPQV